METRRGGRHRGVNVGGKNEYCGKCLLIKTIYKYARRYEKTVATKTVPGIRTKLPGIWKSQVNNSGHRIESPRGRNQVAGTNIYPFCAIKMQLYQTKIREVGQALAQKNVHKSRQSRTILNNTYIRRKLPEYLIKQNEVQTNVKVRKLHSKLN